MRTVSLLLTALVAGILAPRAKAHAFLDHARPEVGSTINRSPHEIRLWFTESLEPAFSSVEVLDRNRHEVDDKNAHVDPKDRMLLDVSVPRLSPGTYTVMWHVVSIDTHRTEGHFQFTIKPQTGNPRVGGST